MRRRSVRHRRAPACRPAAAGRARTAARGRCVIATPMRKDHRPPRRSRRQREPRRRQRGARPDRSGSPEPAAIGDPHFPDATPSSAHGKPDAPVRRPTSSSSPSGCSGRRARPSAGMREGKRSGASVVARGGPAPASLSAPPTRAPMRTLSIRASSVPRAASRNSSARGLVLRVGRSAQMGRRGAGSASRPG